MDIPNSPRYFTFFFIFTVTVTSHRQSFLPPSLSHRHTHLHTSPQCLFALLIPNSKHASRAAHNSTTTPFFYLF
ncbi:uncharacterized protein FA14DRAFT_91494 [Meira miltonrushii]|uniref:Uncharacterized protein n=1 Tax=Meira miltonrushii TaxID=1280837 RepID=A0A316V236_9BASI|nr:uncharacterized protein FA14DRAFT_91494 [Meira miltonrushii]PWN31617.1 hypothetical protein FA14DRAFT_91494 [Meira miltonrushii]